MTKLRALAPGLYMVRTREEIQGRVTQLHGLGVVWSPEIVFLTLHQVAEPDDRRCRRRHAELSSHLREMCRALVLDHDSLITTPGLVQALHEVDPGVVQQKEPLDQVRYCIALHAGHVDKRVGHGHSFHDGIHILARLRGIAVRHVPQHNIWRQHIRRASAYTILIKPLAVQNIHGCRGKSVKGVRVVAEEPTPTLLHRGPTKRPGRAACGRPQDWCWQPSQPPGC